MMEVNDNEESQELSSSCIFAKRRKLHESSSHDVETSTIIGDTGDSGTSMEIQDDIDGEENLLHLFFPKDDDILSKPAVVFDNGKGFIEELYYSTLDIAANFIQNFIKLETSNDPHAVFVGVNCNLGVLYPVLILGILRSGNAFFNVDSSKFEMAMSDGMRLLDMKYIFTESKLAENCKINFCSSMSYREKVVSIPSTQFTFYFYEVTHVIKINRAITNEISQCQLPFAYAIQTSGTTGKNKTVLVPHSCIFPNVKDFIRRWKVAKNDVVFGAAPPTFDPHIVELFVTLGTGATIVYTTPKIKLNGSALSKMLNTHCVSILQVTPSLFRRIHASMKTFYCRSSLRIVAFGGEKCPSNSEINDMSKSIHSCIVFQNVYGVTEVSAWASVCKIDLNSSDEVSIGDGILETQVGLANVVDGVGEIVISSTSRFCVIIDQNDEVKRTATQYYTGDFGKLTENGIVFLGRKDRIVKRNGMKVPLHVIEDMAISAGLFSYAECLMRESQLYLFVQLKLEFETLLNKENLQNDLKCRNLTIMSALSHRLDLPLFMHPDHVIAIKQIPVNSNGKVDFNALFHDIATLREIDHKHLGKYFFASRDQILKTLEPVWRSCTWPGIRAMQKMLHENFIHVGGNSASAARFVESAFTSLKLFGSDLHQKNEHNVLNEIFRGCFETIVDLFYEIIQSQSQNSCLENLKSLEPYPVISFQEPSTYPLNLLPMEKVGFEYDKLKDYLEDEDIFHVESSSHPHDSFSSQVEFPVQLLNMYDFKLGLCVDASATVVPKLGNFMHERAIVGCHGGILICIDLDLLRDCQHASNTSASSGCIVWKRTFPNRIESTVTIDDQCLQCYVGCHDGHLYKINVSNGAIVCRFVTSNNDSIRSQAALSKDHQLVIFIDSANNIYCVNSFDLNLKWILRSYKMLATITPLISKKYCFVSTLDKGIVALNLLNGNVRWSCGQNVTYSSPLLVSNFQCKNDSQYFNKKQIVILCETNCDGFVGLEAREIRKGHLIWRYDTSPNMAKYHSSLSSPVSVSDKCCNRIIWLSNSELGLFETNDGMSRTSCNFIELKSVINHFLIQGKSNRKIKEGECAVFCSMTKVKMLIVWYVHSKKTERIYPWFIHEEFESFSKPVVHKEFIIFGGRDNKLHVIKCKI